MIHQTWEHEPGWPSEEGRTRSVIDGIWVDWSGVKPEPIEVRAVHPGVPPTPQQLRAKARAIAAAKLAEPVDDVDPVLCALKLLRDRIEVLERKTAKMPELPNQP